MIGQKAFRVFTYNLPGASIFMVSLDCETIAEMKDTKLLILSVLPLAANERGPTGNENQLSLVARGKRTKDQRKRTNNFVSIISAHDFH